MKHLYKLGKNQGK